MDVSDTLSYALKGKIAYQISGSSLIYFAPVSIENQFIGVLRFDHSLKNNQQFIADIRHLFRMGERLQRQQLFNWLCLFLSHCFSHRYASKTSQQIRKGHYLTHVPFKRRDELGELSQGLFL